MRDQYGVQRRVAPGENGEGTAALETISAAAPRPNNAPTASTRRAFWAVFALRHLLTVQSIPRDPPEAALGPEGKTASEKLVRALETRVLQRILDAVHAVHPQPAPEIPRIRPDDLTPEY